MAERQHHGDGSGPRGHGLRARRLSVMIGSVLAATAPGARADAGDWKSSATLSLSSTMSNNIGLAPQGQERSELTLQTAPSIALSRNTGRLSFRGVYSPIFLGYVNNTNADNVVNNLNTSATLEAVDRFFFIDARATIAQSFLSPFGAQPADVATQTSNRTETRTIGLSPYIRGRLPGGGSYQVRDDYTYSTFGSGGLSQTTTNRVSASVSDAPGSLVVFSADASYAATEFQPAPATVSTLGRGRATLNVNTEFNAFVTAGYEDNDYSLSRKAGAIYGGGFEWNPSSLTAFRANSERRYFGTSLNIEFSHRTRMSVWRLRINRGEQSFLSTQSVTEGYNTRELLDSLYSSLYPDPTVRAQVVDAYMRSSGLPESLNGQRQFVAPRITRIEAIEPSMVLTGVRNSVTFGAYRRETVPLSASLSGGLPDPFSTQGGFRQTGFNLQYLYSLTSFSRVGVGMDRFRTRSIGGDTTAVTPAATSADTRQTIFRLSFTQQLSNRSSGAITLRQTTIDNAGSGNTVEHAVVGTFTHRFF